MVSVFFMIYYYTTITYSIDPVFIKTFDSKYTKKTLSKGTLVTRKRHYKEARKAIAFLVRSMEIGHFNKGRKSTRTELCRFIFVTAKW